MCFWLCAACVAMAQMPLCLGDNYYQKRMVKVFEALQDQKLDKVAKYWQDIEEKAAQDGTIQPLTPIAQQLFPVWQLSEAMMMNTRSGHGKLTSIVPYNPWGAYMQFKKACFKPEDRHIADQFLAHKNLQMSVAGIKADIEKNLVDTVRKINTESAYDQLIELLFDYDDISTIEKEREQIAYNNTKHTDELSECQRYLDKYAQMNASHHFTMEWRRDSLAFERLGKTAAACKAYLAAYPSSRFNNTVQELLHRYAFQELEESVQACQEYLKLYPESEFNDTVKSLEMEYAFRDAKISDNIGVYNQYLIDYPKSPFKDEAQQLLHESMMKRYFNPTVTLDALHRFCESSNELEGADKSRIRSLYRNLVFIPTSAFMKGCDGLLGKVVLASSPDMLQEEEIMIFNDQGLLVRHYNPSQGINDRYFYGFDPEHGFMLQSKASASGKVVNYVTKWNEEGDMLEVAGSDGSILGFARDYDYMKRVIHFKGRNPVRTDYYSNEFKLDKSVLSGNMTISYEYNLDGDRAAVYKRKGNAVVDSTTYQYGYDANGTSGRLWNWKNQSNNGKLQATRYRKYNNTIDKVFGNSYNAYSIDWARAPQEADTARVTTLINELDNLLMTRFMAAQSAVQVPPSSVTPIPQVQPSQAQLANDAPQPAPATAPEPAVAQAAPPATPVQEQHVAEEMTQTGVEETPAADENPITKLMRDMVFVEGGVFMMGATPEQDDDAWELEFPAHQVKLSSFYICKYEVTQELWELVMGSNPSTCTGKNMPVDMVSWDDCQKFIEKLNEMTGVTFRLPTEAEWEFAARGGNKSQHCKYSGDNEVGRVAWYNLNAEDTSHPVGKKAPNELGLYDMSGNVWEWCADWHNFYTEDIQTNPVGDYPSQGRIQRGGCWNQSDGLCRVSFRGVSSPGMRVRDNGLRLVATKLKK